MRVDIPTAMLRNGVCATAKLLLTIIPYKKESTEWPDRFSYVSILLCIPQCYVRALTLEHTCTLHLDITSNDEPEEMCNFHEQVQIRPDSPEAEGEWKLLRHTNVFDAEGKNLSLCAMARLHVELPPYHLEEEEGFTKLVWE